jgi:hypothetical protein
MAGVILYVTFDASKEYYVCFQVMGLSSAADGTHTDRVWDCLVCPDAPVSLGVGWTAVGCTSDGN